MPNGPDLDLLLGPPGTGKTTQLVTDVERHVATHAPDTVALVSFTNAAADVAKARVASALDMSADDFPHFRTIHSLAFKALKLSRGDIVDRASLAEFSERVGEDLTLTREPGAIARTPGDAYLRTIELAGAMGRDLMDVWAATDEHLSGTSDEGCAHFADDYQAFKRSAGLYDFNDLLRAYIAIGQPLDVRFAVIDEAQDLTHLQWQVVCHAFKTADRLLVAGDDDQAIYAWAGADLPTFLALGDHARTTQVLDQSYRLPEAIHAVAQAQVQRITRRYPKAFRPRAAPGTVEWHGSLASVPLDGDDVLVLARNAYLLDGVEARLRAEGKVYVRDGRPSVSSRDVDTLRAWLSLAPDDTVPGETIKALYAALGRPTPSVKRHAPEALAAWSLVPNSEAWETAFVGWSPARRHYYRTVLDYGNKLSGAPTVTLSTIHASKGEQAKTVILLTDVSARSARHGHTDDEHRVFYVGITRAIETLHLVSPHLGPGYLL